jgi:chorismate--pyruvate lyase
MNSSLHWQDVQALSQQQLPAHVRQWLLDSGSLTQRLKVASAGNFHVKCLSQGWQVPTIDEARLLGLQSRQCAWVREVELYCYDQPWVYARSVIPPRSLAGRLGFLRKLQNSALGSLLFKDPFLQRSHFAVSLLQRQGQTIFGRRSLFHLYHQPLLVAEFFLPACKLADK